MDMETNNRLTAIENSLVALYDKYLILERDMQKYATQSQLKTSESNTKNLINDNSMMINDLEKRLETIKLPQDTRYYLGTIEIEDFRNNYQTLIAMMTDAEKLYRSLISYVTQFKVK